MELRAVLFDIGGVVVGSPLHAIAAYERELGLASNFVNRIVVSTGASGAWSRLERGELALEEFYVEFERDCVAAGPTFSARVLMERIALIAAPIPEMLEAIRRIRARGLRTGAITNNWVHDAGGGVRELREHFDVFVESAVEGIRKPDPRIYRIACERLGVTPDEAAFLDDIGANLRAARELGMATIKVNDAASALAELEALLGLVLRD